jgi:hypothetical protein
MGWLLLMGPGSPATVKEAAPSALRNLMLLGVANAANRAAIDAAGFNDDVLRKFMGLGLH